MDERANKECRSYRELILQELYKASKEDQQFKDEIIQRLTLASAKNPLTFSSGRLLLDFFVEDVRAERTPDPRLLLFAARSFDLILNGIDPKNALGLAGKKAGNPNPQRKPDVLKWTILEENLEPKGLGHLNDNSSRIRKLVELLVQRFGGQKKKAMEAVAEISGYSYKQITNICRGI